MKPFFLLLMISFPAFSQDSLQTFVLSDVVVTGQFEPQSVRESVYQVRTINYDMITRRAPVNVQSVLSTELGIRFSNDLTLGTSDISLMGMSGQNIKILLDGVPLLDRGATRESLNQIDVNTIERIEIVEGPMSVVYGTDALAGVINVITKKNDSTFSVDAGVLEESAGNEYEPFQGKGIHNENVSVYWSGKHWNVGGGVTRNNFGGWNEGRAVDPVTSREWHPKDQWHANGSVGYHSDKFNVWYRLNFLDEVITTLGNTNVNTNMATDKEYQTDRYNHQVQGEWRIADTWNFSGAIAYQDYTRRTLTTTYNVATGDRRLSTEAGAQDEARFNNIMVRGMFVHQLSEKLSIQPGFDVNLSEGSGDRIDKQRNINDYAGFLSVEYKPTSKISLRPGVRFIHNSVYDAPPIIPSLNTKFVLNEKFDLRLAYAYGFRAPSLRELYFYFFDASHSIKGNPDLKAEYSNSFSGSVTWHSHTSSSFRTSSTLTGFYNAYENLIDIGYDPANPQVNTYVNIYKYRTAGGTLDNRFSWKNFAGSLGVSYIGIYNLLSEDDASLPSLTWTPEVNVTASYTFEKLGASLGLYYKFTGERSNYEIVSVDGDVVTNLATREAFHLADVTATKKITPNVVLSTGVKNVFDVTNLQNSSLNKGGSHSTGGSVPMSYGRSYFLSLAFHLGK